MNRFQDNGYELVKGLLSDTELGALKAGLEQEMPGKSKGGIRNADKKYPAVSKLALSQPLLELAKKYVGGTPSLVRSILFDKNEKNNWLVTWHQDKTIAVSQQIEMGGWGPWSIKDGIHHVQPPIEVLNKMITFRIHIDAATTENGCLKVLPDSHRYGILSSDDIQKLASEIEAVDCEAEEGDVLVMVPHIIHSSSKAISPAKRRIIHIEYSSYILPSELSWAS